MFNNVYELTHVTHMFTLILIAELLDLLKILYVYTPHVTAAVMRHNYCGLHNRSPAFEA